MTQRLSVSCFPTESDVTLKDCDGFTALDRAAGRGFKDLVEPLLVAGAKMNLYDAILLNDRQEVLKFLSENASAVNKPCVSGDMPINLASQYGLREMVELLIQHGAKVNLKKDPPLCTACESGKYDIVKLLLDNGADVNVRSAYGSTALWLASGRLKTMRLLLSKGADVNNTNSDGSTALEHTTYSTLYAHRYSILNELRGSNTNRTPPAPRPRPPIRSNQQVRPEPKDTDPIVETVEPVKLLLEYHANANLADKYGHTPLFGANTKEIAELLVQAGADINARDNRGQTPLRFAENMHNTNVVAFLLSKGATE